jgi:hypothetical protein
MFAPPICRRRWAEQRFTVLPISDDDGGNRANIAASGASNRYSAIARAAPKELREQLQGRRSSNPHRNAPALLGSALR